MHTNEIRFQSIFCCSAQHSKMKKNKHCSRTILHVLWVKEISLRQMKHSIINLWRVSPNFLMHDKLHWIIFSLTSKTMKLSSLHWSSNIQLSTQYLKSYLHFKDVIGEMLFVSLLMKHKFIIPWPVIKWLKTYLCDFHLHANNLMTCQKMMKGQQWKGLLMLFFTLLTKKKNA